LLFAVVAPVTFCRSSRLSAVAREQPADLLQSRLMTRRTFLAPLEAGFHETTSSGQAEATRMPVVTANGCRESA
jgi:hypothetical protein